MLLDITRTRKALTTFEFKSLFIEDLGWNHHDAKLEIPVDGQTFTLSAIAEKCGMAAFVCSSGTNGRIPDYPIRRKIERQVAKSTHEHLIIFIDRKQTTQVWQWVRRKQDKPAACREHTYNTGQPGDSLIQKLQTLAVSLEEEENLTLISVTGRARKAFDVEHVTKKFYDRFKNEQVAFLKFLKGIPDEEMERWYVSVMLNRLMFIYFIQKKGFLNNDRDYLKNKLAECRKELGKDRFYRDFLWPLFFEGFAKQKGERSDKAKKLLGEVPYLNGGIFMPHQIEQLYGKTIMVPDKAFEKLFEFFNAYQWHLDERPLRKDDEINPDVLGYIFEKYINQKQMGAYYTKEDITQYISKNTVIPFLFDAAREKCKTTFEGKQSVWWLLQEDPDHYIYPAVKHGVELPLPPEIEAGVDPAKPNLFGRRKHWNNPAPSEFALPTEIWREVVARRKRYEEVRGKLAAGKICSINDLITYNLDIRQFVQDVIEHSKAPELLVAFWNAIKRVTVLDPACGSGAFLFAALNILEPLYEACLERMRFFLEEWGESGKKNHPNYYKLFTKTLKYVEDHPNHRYFIFKSIIVNNLYGMDIMEEAIEICKLRLFLKLVAQIEHVEKIEPLPDIDFNIRAGNTLVGFVTLAEIRRSVEKELSGQGKFVFGETKTSLKRIEEDADIVDRAFCKFHEMQTERGMKPADFAEAKENLRERLKKLTNELDHFLASEYGVAIKKKDAFVGWRTSHKPFHWFAEFFGILKAGGFNVIIGNPPFVEYSMVSKEYRVIGFQTEECGNLYAFVVERCLRLLMSDGRMGLITPLSGFATERMTKLQGLLKGHKGSLWVSYYSGDANPAKLFEGVKFRLAIFLLGPTHEHSSYFSTKYLRWYAEERPVLFSSFGYCDALTHIKSDSMPKIGYGIIPIILRKVTQRKPLSSSMVGHKQQLLYHNCPVNWIRATTFVPAFKSERDGVKVSTQLHPLYFEDNLSRDIICCTINSSVFFLNWLSYSDCYHLTNRELLSFGVDVNQFVTSQGKLLSKLCSELMRDYQEKSRKRTYVYKSSGKVVYDEFYPKLSKPIIDDIDQVLAKHYGFTDEELDFIINYDIKYRMGQDSKEAKEE